MYRHIDTYYMCLVCLLLIQYLSQRWFLFNTLTSINKHFDEYSTVTFRLLDPLAVKDTL